MSDKENIGLEFRYSSEKRDVKLWVGDRYCGIIPGVSCIEKRGPRYDLLNSVGEIVVILHGERLADED